MKKYFSVIIIVLILLFSSFYHQNKKSSFLSKIEILKTHFYTSIDTSQTCPIYVIDEGFKNLYTVQDDHLNFKLNILEYKNRDYCKNAFLDLTGYSLDHYSLGYSYYYQDDNYIYYFEALNSEGVKEYLEAIHILKN